MNNVSLRVMLALVVSGWGFCASAQLTSDLVPRERTVPRAVQVEREVEQSRYRLGPFFLHPQLIFRNFGYTDNVLGSATDPQSDWTATVAGGFRFITPMGRKLYIRGNVLPEYTWYKELTDRRYFGGTYDAAFLALFNRMQVEAGARTTRTIANISSELEAPAERTSDYGNVDVELQVLPKISLFAGGAVEKNRYESDIVLGGTSSVDNLDRDDSAIRGGVRWAPRDFFDIRLGIEQTTSEFVTNPLRRDNESQAVLLGIHYDRPSTYANLSIGRREGTALNNSNFPEYETTTGSYFLSHELSAPVEGQLYGHRRVVYGVSNAAPYFLETRYGAAVETQIANRVSLRAFGDLGDNDYDLSTQPRPAFIAARKDEAVTFGGGVAFRVYRNIALNLVVSQTDYDSNVTEFDRSIVKFYSGITFTGDFSR